MEGPRDEPEPVRWSRTSAWLAGRILTWKSVPPQLCHASGLSCFSTNLMLSGATFEGKEMRIFPPLNCDCTAPLSNCRVRVERE